MPEETLRNWKAGEMCIRDRFYPVCMDNGVCDYLKLWILTGIPFGVHRMFVWVIPKGFDIGGTIGVLVVNLLAGGVIAVSYTHLSNLK